MRPFVLLAFAGLCSTTTAQSEAGPDRLRVLVWNIQRGSNQFDRGPEKALAVLRAVAPDVCLLQESYDINGPRPKNSEPGWPNNSDGTSGKVTARTCVC